NCVLAFLLLGVVASGGYLVNDIVDLAADRAHWSKKKRPLASGELALAHAMAAAPAMTLGGVALGVALNPLFGAALAGYLALTLLYTFHLKRIAMVDTVTLATLFTLRIVMGVPLVGAEATPWLLAFSMTLFLSLSLAKRHAELLRKAMREPGGAVAGRGYAVADSDLTLAMGVSTAMLAIVVLMLYVMGEAASAAYRSPAWLWATPLILYLWLSRVWLKCHRGLLHDDPVVFALRDRPSLALALCAAAAFAGATWG
ncbi:MAG: UbiA family prenyltransferase, partial [Parvularculaceae bacterium]|nr:UbiA family prenyltransferase [Parvularculaceae bacterium]